MCYVVLYLFQLSGVLDGAFETQVAALKSLSHLLYDEMIKSVLKIIEKLDLSVQKLTPEEEEEEEVRLEKLFYIAELIWMLFPLWYPQPYWHCWFLPLLFSGINHVDHQWHEIYCVTEGRWCQRCPNDVFWPDGGHRTQQAQGLHSLHQPGGAEQVGTPASQRACVTPPLLGEAFDLCRLSAASCFCGNAWTTLSSGSTLWVTSSSCSPRDFPWSAASTRCSPSPWK